MSRWWPVKLGRRPEPKIGLALGGGFARGLAHIGVLRVLERNRVPLHAIAGVSAGAVAAAAYASGASTAEIEAMGRQMRFSDVSRWTVSRLGLAGTDRMEGFLGRLLKVKTFEEMKIPLAVVATDLAAGSPMVFRGHGDVVMPIRASCSFPGLFQPLKHHGRYLVDGFVSMEVPAQPPAEMGATHVIAVSLPNAKETADPASLFSVVDRCFQIMSKRLEPDWRRHAALVIEPRVADVPWDAFGSADRLIAMGEEAGEAAMAQIEGWLGSARPPKPARAHYDLGSGDRL